MRARRVEQLRVLERRHHGQQGVEPGLGSGAPAERAVASASNARRTCGNPALASPRAPAAPYFAETDEPRDGLRGARRSGCAAIRLAAAATSRARGTGVQGGRRDQQAERPQGTAVAAARQAPPSARCSGRSRRVPPAVRVSARAGAAGRGRHRREAGRQRLGRPAQGAVVLAGRAGAEITRVGQSGLGGQRQLPGQRVTAAWASVSSSRLLMRYAGRLRGGAGRTPTRSGGVGPSPGAPLGGVPPPPPPLPAPVFSASGSIRG